MSPLLCIFHLQPWDNNTVCADPCSLIPTPDKEDDERVYPNSTCKPRVIAPSRGSPLPVLRSVPTLPRGFQVSYSILPFIPHSVDAFLPLCGPHFCCVFCCSWANREEVWKIMLNKEKTYLRDQHFLEQHPLLQPKMRAILLDWLMEVSLSLPVGFMKALSISSIFVYQDLCVFDSLDTFSISEAIWYIY